MRLDKYLTNQGIGSRSQVKALIKSKKVFVNNVLENKPERHIEENNDIVSLDGVNLEYNKLLLYVKQTSGSPYGSKG